MADESFTSSPDSTTLQMQGDGHDCWANPEIVELSRETQEAELAVQKMKNFIHFGKYAEAMEAADKFLYGEDGPPT